MPGRLLICGAGAIGGTVAAYLARAGHDVTLVDSSQAHIDAIRETGLRIVGPVDRFTVQLPALTPDEVTGTWPIIALAVKAQQTEDACLAMLPHLASDGYVLSLQNGLCETIIEPIVGRRRTMGALVGFMGDQVAPGEIRFAKRARFCIGELDGRLTDRVVDLRKLLADFEPEVEVTDDIWGFLWGKLGFIVFLFATALGRSGLVDLFGDDRLLPVWRQLGGEILMLATKEGIEPRGFDGFEPRAFTPGQSAAAARASMQDMANFLRASPKTHSGMWRDIAIHRRATEAGAQLGPLLAIAARRGLAVPALERLADLVGRVERGEAKQSDALIPTITGVLSQDDPADPNSAPVERAT